MSISDKNTFNPNLSLIQSDSAVEALSVLAVVVFDRKKTHCEYLVKLDCT